MVCGLLRHCCAGCAAGWQAKDTIRVDYYLKSADAVGKAAELKNTRIQCARQTSEYRERYDQTRPRE